MSSVSSYKYSSKENFDLQGIRKGTCGFCGDSSTKYSGFSQLFFGKNNWMVKHHSTSEGTNQGPSHSFHESCLVSEIVRKEQENGTPQNLPLGRNICPYEGCTFEFNNKTINTIKRVHAGVLSPWRGSAQVGLVLGSIIVLASLYGTLKAIVNMDLGIALKGSIVFILGLCLVSAIVQEQEYAQHVFNKLNRTGKE